MVTVNTDFDLDIFEAALSEIAAGDTKLRLASRIKAEAVGGLAAMVQLIITWARAGGTETELQVHAKDLADPAMSRFACTVTGLTALNFARQIHTVQGQHPIERAAAMNLALPFVEAMHARSLVPLRDFSKTTIPLLCLDNARSFRRPTRLYQAQDRVRDRADIADLLAACFEAVGPDFRRAVGAKLVTSAASLVYEAFLNTHEHAQADFRGDRLARSVRGVLVGYRSVAVAALAAAAGRSAPLLRHFEDWRPDHPDAQHAQFMDISIFDSGSGLAQTWLARQSGLARGIVEEAIPLEVEFQAVLACLRKGGTTKIGDTSGNGLYRIMEVVRQAGGFIRIRSGRLSLGRAFEVGAPALDPADVFVHDMLDGGRPIKPRAWAEGTTLSVLLPLNRSVQ